MSTGDARPADYVALTEELARASSALSRANAAAAGTPYWHLVGAVLDTVTALEELVSPSANCWPVEKCALCGNVHDPAADCPVRPRERDRG